MKKICYICPGIPEYIIPLFRVMAKESQLNIVYSAMPSKHGFGRPELFEHKNVNWIALETIYPFGKSFGMYQKGILKHIVKNRPDALLIFANPRYLSFWAVLLVGRVLGIETYPRGHGLAKRESIGCMQKLLYALLGKLCTRYICYTPSVRESLAEVIKDQKFLAVDYNTLENPHAVQPSKKTGNENGIFYIGRLRARCGVDILIDAVRFLRQETCANIELHVVGDGQMAELVRKQSEKDNWIQYHGMVYDHLIISGISLKCRFGCYPLDVGLSVVHMMSLSLPPLTHGEMTKHMGPEASYVQHGKNGWLYFPRNDFGELARSALELWEMPEEKMKLMQKAAFECYRGLSTPSHATRILQIIGIEGRAGDVVQSS